MADPDHGRLQPGHRRVWPQFSGPLCPRDRARAPPGHLAESHAALAVCGIPARFYNDHGSDFTSTHLEQVSADLKMVPVFSQPVMPRGRGRSERFFQTIERLLLCRLPGSSPAGPPSTPPTLTLPAFEIHVQTFIAEEYHQRPHGETGIPPQARWDAGGWLPRLPESLEQLDLLLLTLAKQRRVQRDGIRFHGFRYLDPMLAAYVGEDVVIRYDPRDIVEIQVYHRNTFLCHAVCQELAGYTISLQAIEQARNQRRKAVRQTLRSRAALVETLCACINPTGWVRQRSHPVGLMRHVSSGTNMNNQMHPVLTDFLVTKEYRRFAEFCEACRCHRYIGLCYSPPGVRKTLSAYYYARWDIVLAERQRIFDDPPAPEPFERRTVVYTAPVVNTRASDCA